VGCRVNAGLKGRASHLSVLLHQPMQCLEAAEEQLQRNVASLLSQCLGDLAAQPSVCLSPNCADNKRCPVRFSWTEESLTSALSSFVEIT